MAALSQNLNDFADGRIDFADLMLIVEEVAIANPSASSALTVVLGQACDTGVLSDEQHQELLEWIIRADTLDVTSTGDKVPLHMQSISFSVGPAAGDLATVGDGSIVKERFELDGVLGQGGMGIVYRAKDRIKVEARDRNPYVALKVLNEDFKAHAESFIALQRECSRTQKLAHPNIATVYDFDRTGGMAFLIMELLEGMPLNKYIEEKLPANGFSFMEAWPIIDSLGQALAFAHRRNVVHSDFKPANAFITNDGAIKVLDFGIARAFKKPGHAETTMFDAGKLGALTPRYASCEMLEGEPPDPRDDIFALAVVSYVLLSGKHPYEGKAANMAKALNMKPPRIKALSKLQNRALKGALAFERDERTPNVEEFLQQLQGEMTAEQKLKRQTRLLAVVSAGFVILTLCVLFLLRG
jgi:serine/threonine protein kinase